jgi:hypothetical protein
LASSDALSHEYLGAEVVRDVWRDHLSGSDRSELLGRYLTFELWLRMLRYGREEVVGPLSERFGLPYHLP